MVELKKASVYDGQLNDEFEYDQIKCYVKNKVFYQKFGDGYGRKNVGVTWLNNYSAR